MGIDQGFLRGSVDKFSWGACRLGSHWGGGGMGARFESGVRVRGSNGSCVLGKGKGACVDGIGGGESVGVEGL